MKININQSEKIAEVLDIMQKRKTVNILNCADLHDLANKAEQKLEDLKIPKKYRKGARIYYHDAGPADAAYKYSGQGATMVKLERRAAGWFLVNAIRTSLNPKEKRCRSLHLTNSQKEIAFKHIGTTY